MSRTGNIMKYTNFIATRYLFEKKRISLISTLTLISIVGVTLGTALLIVVLSVFNGFFDVVKGLLLSYDPDIRIEAAAGNRLNIDPERLQQINELPEIKAISSYISGRALLTQHGKNDQILRIKGINLNEYFKITDLEQKISRGESDLSIKNRLPGVLLSEQLMTSLRLRVGATVTLMSSAGMEKALTHFTAPNIYRFEVRGSYTMEKSFNEAIAFISMEAGQRLMNMQHNITGIDVKLREHNRANEVKKELQALLGNNYKVSTWYDLQKPLYDVMNLEKWGAFFILMIIVLVAILNIVGSLTMIVIQKKRDIGVLRTIGLTRRDIRNIFLKQGLYIGLSGCIIGGTTGLLLTWLQGRFGIVGLSDSFIIDAYPVSINPLDICLILSGSLILCVLASWYPAARATLVEPANAVRYE